MNATPTLERELPVRTFSIDGLWLANVVVPTHTLGTATGWGSFRTVYFVDNFLAGSSLLAKSGAIALRFSVRHIQSIAKAAAIQARKFDVRATLFDGFIVVEPIEALGCLSFNTYAILKVPPLPTSGRVVAQISTMDIVFIVPAER